MIVDVQSVGTGISTAALEKCTRVAGISLKNGLPSSYQVLKAAGQCSLSYSWRCPKLNLQVPVMLMVYPNGDGYFQQDNAPSHTAGIVQERNHDHNLHVPIMLMVYPSGNGYFQQDNDPCHTAGIVRRCFEEHHRDLTSLSWLAENDQISILENL
ncbi:hypothetical protein TNCV_4858921 [Trichonephila clavipes]|nr:hypothetical protein TNCV_4858921 [Trichonephila clavipes]